MKIENYPIIMLFILNPVLPKRLGYHYYCNGYSFFSCKETWEIGFPSPTCLLVFYEQNKINVSINGWNDNGMGIGIPLLQEVQQIKLYMSVYTGQDTADCQEGLFIKLN